jgi:hypothetical protein
MEKIQKVYGGPAPVIDYGPYQAEVDRCLERRRKRYEGSDVDAPDDPAAIDTFVRPNLLARLKLRLKKARADKAWDDWLEAAEALIELGDELQHVPAGVNRDSQDAEVRRV